MQATDLHSHGLTTAGAPGREEMLRRLPELESALPKAEVELMRSVLQDAERSAENVRDTLSTRFMEAFRLSAADEGTPNRTAFGLLYELNCHHLLIQVSARLRRYSSKADPRDVLQEVFFNVYRYPHRFNSERDDAFRLWSATIVRNTVLKHIRTTSRGGRTEVPFEDLSDQPEMGAGANPLHGAIETESRAECMRAYLTYLQLYLSFYQMLSERERRALHLVEITDLSYREAAADLGIKLENLKMVIFRARKKIHRSMRRVFEGLPPDCRPARDPGGRGGIETSVNAQNRQGRDGQEQSSGSQASGARS